MFAFKKNAGEMLLTSHIWKKLVPNILANFIFIIVEGDTRFLLNIIWLHIITFSYSFLEIHSIFHRSRYTKDNILSQ